MIIPTIYSLKGTVNFQPGQPIYPEINQVGMIYDAYHDPLAEPLRTRYRFIEVDYPASMLPSGGWSAAQGIENTMKLIRKNPGPFVLVGYSQGALVCSEVYNEIRFGSLQHRRDDLLAGLMCGNPSREAGHTFPGCEDPGGHGIRSSDHRLSGSEELWWEFANPGDPVSVVGDDTPGLVAQACFEWSMNDWDSVLETAVAAAQAALSTLNSVLVAQWINFFTTYFFNPAVLDPETLPHLAYRHSHPIPGDPRSSFDIAVDRLTEIADSLNDGVELPFTLPAALGSNTLEHQCDLILETTNRLRREEEATRRTKPVTRIWDGEWDLQHILANEYSAQLAWISNDSGPAQTQIPFDTPVAKWIHDHQGRIDRGEGRNVHITVDYCGARWSGRMDKYAVQQKADGDIVLVVDWLHDYETVKWYSVWSNPFLPAAFQFPRAFLLAGPVTWILKTALFLQIFREHNPLITMVDDPMDLGSWFTSLDQSNWNVVVKPESFIEAMESGVAWGIVYSRWKTWHDMAHTMLEDSELSVVCRRYLPGDEPPWAGADLRYGTLVIDIVDKSGVYIGTSNGGTVFDGLARTVEEFSEDFIDSTTSLILDTETPEEYYFPSVKLTKKELPYVIFREGSNSPIQTSSWINSPAKGVQVNVGGHSMPGVNEAISATIQAAGDILGSVAQIGSLGGTIDTLLQPIYEDTILAWSSVKSLIRAQNSGWDRYFEYFQDPAGKAFTIASLMVMRAGFWATKTTISWEVEVSDGLPFMVGDNGVGHFFLDDRLGLVLEGDTKINVDRARKIELGWDPDNPPEWKITVGDERIHQDPAQRSWGRIENMVAGMRELGVW